MKKFVFVNAEGQPVYTSQPADEKIYTAGNIYNSLTCYEIPLESTDKEVLTSWYWKAGVQKVRPTKPHEYSVWNSELEIWQDDLALAKTKTWELAKAKKQQEESAGFYWNGLKFDSNALARLSIVTAALSASSDPTMSTVWTLADNSQQTLSASDLIAVSKEMNSFLNAIHQKYINIRAAIDSATAISDLPTIS